MGRIDSFCSARRIAAMIAVSLVAVPLAALPPSTPDPTHLISTGHPVASIPTEHGIGAFKALDGEHVMLSAGDKQYLLTLNRECVGLRWARHVGVTASDNAIWAGFDALTADGQACSIREIHVVREPEEPKQEEL